MDGGTTANILRADVARDLLAAGYVHKSTGNSHSNIHFGRSRNPEPVKYLVKGPAHVGEILVVNEMDADMLISEINFTDQPDTFIIKNKLHALIIQRGMIIIKGSRVPTEKPHKNIT